MCSYPLYVFSLRMTDKTYKIYLKCILFILKVYEYIDAYILRITFSKDF